MSKDNKSSMTTILVATLFIIAIGGSYYIGKLRAENKALTDMLGVGDSKDNLVEDVDVPKQPDTNTQAKNVNPVSEDDHIRGNPDAKIALIEYSDYQCPFCIRFHETAKQAVEKYDGDLMWVYRHFPLDSLHPHARTAAQASECVAELAGNDAFWTFSDALFDRQDEINEDKIDELALKSGIDQTEYENCLTSEETAKKVEDDLSNGSESGVRGTPGTILLNTETGEVESLPGAVPLSNIETTINKLLE